MATLAPSFSFCSTLPLPMSAAYRTPHHIRGLSARWPRVPTLKSSVTSVSPLSRTNAPWQRPSGGRRACLARCRRRPASPRARPPRCRSTNTFNRPLSMHPAHTQRVSPSLNTQSNRRSNIVCAHVVIQAHRRHQRPNTLLKAVLPEVFLRLVRTAHDDHVEPVYTCEQTISGLFSTGTNICVF